MFVVGGPGVGKSRLLVQLGQWIPEALSGVVRGAGGGAGAGGGGGGVGAAARDTVRDTVVLMIKTGNGMALSSDEKRLDGGHLLASRMLYAAFCPPTIDFPSFARDICGFSGHLQFSDALGMILHALGDKDVNLVLLVDEAHELCVQVPNGGHKDAFPYVVWLLVMVGLLADTSACA